MSTVVTKQWKKEATHHSFVLFFISIAAIAKSSCGIRRKGLGIVFPICGAELCRENLTSRKHNVEVTILGDCHVAVCRLTIIWNFYVEGTDRRHCDCI